jgi:hypothetical protein
MIPARPGIHTGVLFRMPPSRGRVGAFEKVGVKRLQQVYHCMHVRIEIPNSVESILR